MISHSELTKLLIDLEHTTPKLLPAFIGKVIQATSAGVVREGGLLPKNIGRRLQRVRCSTDSPRRLCKPPTTIDKKSKINLQGIEYGQRLTESPVTIPDIDETTIRAIAVQAASTLENKDVTEMLAKADAIQEFIDPQAYGNEFTFTMEP